MKTDLSKQTKYFWKEYNKDTMEFELKEIPFNKDTWFYAQVDATIRTAFLKYDFPIPPYVIVEKLTHYMTFYIIRDKIKNEKELLKWQEKCVCIKSDLDIQAKCNSTEIEDDEDCIIYNFEIL
jgi:hypothetical protein